MLGPLRTRAFLVEVVYTASDDHIDFGAEIGSALYNATGQSLWDVEDVRIDPTLEEDLWLPIVSRLIGGLELIRKRRWEARPRTGSPDSLHDYMLSPIGSAAPGTNGPDLSPRRAHRGKTSTSVYGRPI